mmetsp:Transcript_1746/g.1617  ORF Transcript_1746/g.1617 Transcript_1746/m.1617 type:complete len:84 (-) Transcript_1746:30-281(-)
MISQFFVLSARGDCIINRDYRHDLIKNTPEIFFRNVKTDKSDAPPIFNVDGINFYYTKKNTGLLFVMTSGKNTSPAFVQDALT